MKGIMRIAVFSVLACANMAAGECYRIRAKERIMSYCDILRFRNVDASGCESVNEVLFIPGCARNFGQPENKTDGAYAPSNGVVCYGCVLTHGRSGSVGQAGYVYNVVGNDKNSHKIDADDGWAGIGHMFCPSYNSDRPFGVCPTQGNLFVGLAIAGGVLVCIIWSACIILIHRMRTRTGEVELPEEVVDNEIPVAAAVEVVDDNAASA